MGPTSLLASALAAELGASQLNFDGLAGKAKSVFRLAFISLISLAMMA